MMEEIEERLAEERRAVMEQISVQHVKMLKEDTSALTSCVHENGVSITLIRHTYAVNQAT